MHFEFTVTAGQIANVIAFFGLIVALAHYHRVKAAEDDKKHQDNQQRLTHIENKIGTVWRWFERNVINGHGAEEENT